MSHYITDIELVELESKSLAEVEQEVLQSLVVEQTNPTN